MILAAALLLLTAAEDLAVEVRSGNFPAYLRVPPAAYGSALLSSFRRVNGVPIEDPRYVSAIQMFYRAEGAEVRLDVGVLFGRFDQNDTPRSLEGIPRQAVGSYLIPLNTSVWLNELVRFGVEPFEVRTVPLKPEVLNPPAIENRTTALSLVSVDDDRNTYPVRLKNVSQKNIIALELRSPRGRDRSSQRGTAKLPRVLIAPDEIYTVLFSVYRGGRNTPAGFVADPPARQLIVISAVVFDDGSWEGEPETAAAILASLYGLRLQLARIVPGLEAFHRSGSDDPAELLAMVASLPEEPSQSEIDEAAVRFEALSRDALARELRHGLRMRREQLVLLLKSYERNQWKEMSSRIESTIQQYREELQALP
jgi:hypothetical protein